MGKTEVAATAAIANALIKAEREARNSAFLAREASYATPGTKANNAYHAELDRINAMALEIRAKAGR